MYSGDIYSLLATVPVCSGNCWGALNGSEAEIRSVARRRVRKSRGVQALRRSTPTRERIGFLRMTQRYPNGPGCAQRTAEGGCTHISKVTVKISTTCDCK